MKLIYSLIICFITSITIYAQSITEYNLPPAPIFACGDAPSKLNQILYGAIPPNSSNKPIVVFVHGWGDNGYGWFVVKNEWYKKCYAEGFRTAFLFQPVAGSYQENGKIIAEMLKKIIKKYNSNNIVIVAHSKGGVDVEWALFNYNMADKVNGVISMSSPYFGAPLADYLGNPIIRSIAELIPIVSDIVKGGGTLQMQPAYSVGVMRQMFDNHPQNNPQKFRCFGAYNGNHKTELPSPNIPDDFLSLVFYDYKPLCLDLPIGKLGGELVSLPMSIGNILNLLVMVPKYNQNKAGDIKINDGVAPYYSAIRSGSIEISSTTSPTSNINHIDELFSKYTWEMVRDNVYYFNEHPQYIKTTNPESSSNKRTIEPKETLEIQSKMQLIQNKNIHFTVGEHSIANLILIGNYNNIEYKITNSKDEVISSSNINNDAKTIYQIFNKIDINQLPEGYYTLKSSTPINAILVDDSKAEIELDIKDNQISVQLNNWTDNIDNIKVEVTANRNIDEEGNVIWDKIIPIQLDKDVANNRFISKNFNFEKDGTYNISVYAKSNSTQRFLTTSIYNSNKREFPITKAIQIFPNPTSGDFTVEWQNALEHNNLVQIFDLQGKTMYQKIIDGNKKYLQLNTKLLGLQNGIYLININGKSEKLLVQ